MRNYDSMSGDIITSHSRPLKNVIGKHRKRRNGVNYESLHLHSVCGFDLLVDD